MPRKKREIPPFLPMFDLPVDGSEKATDHPKKLKLNLPAGRVEGRGYEGIIEGIPALILPTRWEYLQQKLGDNDASIKTIIRPVPQAIRVVRDIIEYLRATGGCQVLIIRADTGSGKTTFLNTLPYYMSDVNIDAQTIDLQPIEARDFGVALRRISLSNEAINVVILEGREKPETVSDGYIQMVLADINRFARSAHKPLLFVIPTIEEAVARAWCDHGTRIGDLIPDQKLYEGSRWYTFPGVPREKFADVAAETVRTLNAPYTISDFGVGSDDIQNLALTAPTIGRFIETLANKISSRRSASRVSQSLSGKREHVWVVFCGPDFRHFDHTYLVLDGLCHDEKLRVSPAKLVAPDAQTSQAKHWRQGATWARLVATINFLDVRVINLPITTVVAAALAHGNQALLNSFKETRFESFRAQLEAEVSTEKLRDFDWSQPLVDRRLGSQNARDSLERTNLWLLLRSLPAGPQKGGKTESINVLAQYLHLRDVTNESELHYYVGCTLRDLLKHNQFSGLIGDGVETETPMIPGQTDPVPDITVHTDSDTYALEFHFSRKQFASSEIARYALDNVIEKYMRSMPHLRAALENIE